MRQDCPVDQLGDAHGILHEDSAGVPRPRRNPRSVRRESRWADPLALVATRRYIGPCFLLFKKYIFRIIYLFYMGGWGDFVICCRCAWCSRVIGLWWWMDVGGACVRVMCGGNDVRRGCMTDVMVVCRDWLSRVDDMVVDGGRRELLRVWLLSFFLPITFLVWIFDVRASVASKDCQQRLHTYC